MTAEKFAWSPAVHSDTRSRMLSMSTWVSFKWASGVEIQKTSRTSESVGFYRHRAVSKHWWYGFLVDHNTPCVGLSTVDTVPVPIINGMFRNVKRYPNKSGHTNICLIRYKLKFCWGIWRLLSVLYICLRITFHQYQEEFEASTTKAD